MGQFSGTHISQTTGLIFLKFGMYTRVYGGHPICEFDRNWLSNYQDTRGKKGKLAIHVNSTLVHHTAFLVADT